MMKKTLLTLATVVTASFLSMAADCGSGGAKECTLDTECEAEEICDIAEGDETGLCSVFTPECADDVDCDLANSESPVEAKDCSTDTDCSDDDTVLCVTDGVGETYCALANEDTAGGSCEEADPTYSTVTISGKEVCIVDVSQSCDDAGQCVAE